jgi:hypothetical protein
MVGKELISEITLCGITERMTLNPSAASAPSCSKEHDPTKSVGYVQGKRTKLHERAPSSKTN